MPFLQLTFESDSLDSDALESAAFAAGALSVTLTDAADAPIFEPDLNTTPLWPRVRVSILFAAGASRSQILVALDDVPPEHSFTEIADRLWEREWLADFKPMSFGARLWICPHEQSVPAKDAVVVKLDPGLAFGAGTHPTTAMCLKWLDGAQLKGKEVIDYGCGSGILAIAAVKLGARRAFAVDHDPQALLATRENAERNSVERQIEVLPCDAPVKRVDVLLANILAQPLIELAPRFQTLVKPGGDLVLSGILVEQADAVAAAYAPWFEMDEPAHEVEWVRLHGIRIKAPGTRARHR
jgi:ribosomal protein L11 methyltransferase